MSATTVVRYRNRVAWRDLVWVTWRQHRTMLVSTGLLVLVGTVAMLILAGILAAHASMRLDMFTIVDALADRLVLCVLGYAGVVAAFWAAPLLSREYEQRTHLFAWSQDVSAARWLAGKTLVLTVAAVALALLLGTAAQIMISQFDSVTVTGTVARRLNSINPFGMPYFEAVPLVQVGYTLFGFALGLVLSMTTRRTLLSMGLALAGFIITRAVVATTLRPHYLPPVRVTSPLGADGPFDRPEDVLYVDAGLLGPAGNPVDYPQACMVGRRTTQAEHLDCMHEHGVVGTYREYQPAGRLDTFQLIEFGLFTVLAVALFLLAWRGTRRMTRA